MKKILIKHPTNPDNIMPLAKVVALLKSLNKIEWPNPLPDGEDWWLNKPEILKRYNRRKTCHK